MKESVCAELSKSGQLMLLKRVVMSKEYPLDKRAARGAAESGHLHVLEWLLVQREGPWDPGDVVYIRHKEWLSERGLFCEGVCVEPGCRERTLRAAGDEKHWYCARHESRVSGEVGRVLGRDPASVVMRYLTSPTGRIRKRNGTVTYPKKTHTHAC